MNETTTARSEKESWNQDVNKHQNNYNDDRPPDDLIDDSEKLNDNSTPKNILLYRNGDKYFPPKRFVVNKRYIRTWESFLEELTKTIQPRNGAIRDIRTPFHGTRIKSLEDLTVNGKYVAVSKGEMLKLIDYTNVIDVAKPQPKNDRESRYNKMLKVTNHDMDKIENRINQQLHTKGFYIHVYRNGDPFTRGIKVVLNQFEKKHMSTLVRAIEERVLLQSNRPIRRLYTMEGDIIRYAIDVENGQYYVAAANEPFHNIKYGQYLPVIRGGKVPSSRHRIKYLNKSPTPVTSRHTQENPETNEETYRTQRTLYSDRSKQKTTTGRNHNNDDAEDKDEYKDKAATKIQNAYRKHSARNKTRKSEESNDPTIRTRNQHDPHNTTRQSEDKNRNNKPHERKQNPQRKNVSEKATKENNNSKKNEDHKRTAKKDYSRDEDLAAQTIQAAFRGYVFRERGNNVPQTTEQKKEQPVQRKENYQKKEDNQKKGEKPKSVNKEEKKTEDKDEEKKEDNNNDEERQKAAITIQAGFRGYKTRNSLRNNEQVRRREEAATTIQYGYRGYKTRKQINNREDNKNREEAAKIIQYGYRGYRTRKQIKEKENVERRDNAALTIQSSYRGFRTRRELAKREENESREKAALKIQASYRGYVTRKTIESDINARFQEKTAEEQARERNGAASTIQASFRGYKRRVDTVQR